MRGIIISTFVSGIIHLTTFLIPISLPSVIKGREIPEYIEISLVPVKQVKRIITPPEAIKEKPILKADRKRIKAPDLKGEGFVERVFPIAEARVQAHQYEKEIIEGNMGRPELTGGGFIERVLPIAKVHVRALYDKNIIDESTKKFDHRKNPLSTIPRYQDNPIPPYPPIARKKGFEGTVRLEVEVLSTGKAGRIKVRESSGYTILDSCALETVKKWHFAPAQLDGVLVKSTVIIPITFQLTH
jgi:TonB family protein